MVEFVLMVEIDGSRRENFQRRNSPEIQIPLAFAADFAKEASHAQNRVWLQCMDFEMGHASGIVQNALKSAAERGVDTRLTMDGFSVATVNDQIAWTPKSKEAKDFQKVTQRADHDMLASLKAAGVDLTVTNPKIAKFIPVELFPFVGRNHMKIMIVDDVAWFGGVNVASDHFEKADFMVKITDSEIVEMLAGVFTQVNENKPEADYKKIINEAYSVLVDRGDRGKSIILDEALQMMGEAQDTIQFISQLPPSGKVLEKLLERARARVDIDVITQSKDNLNSNGIPFGLLMKRSYKKFLKKTKDFPNIRLHHFDAHHGRVHAKMVIIDEERALWGSHNLDESGVKVGTQEVSMKTSDMKLVPKLVAMFESIQNGTYELGYQEGPFNPQNI